MNQLQPWQPAAHPEPWTIEQYPHNTRHKVDATAQQIETLCGAPNAIGDPTKTEYAYTLRSGPYWVSLYDWKSEGETVCQWSIRGNDEKATQIFVDMLTLGLYQTSIAEQIEALKGWVRT